MRYILQECCGDEWWGFIEHNTQDVNFKKNEYIFKTNNNVLGIYIIEQGHVKIVKENQYTEEKVVRLASHGDIIGHRGFGGDWRYPVSAICYTDTIAKFIPLKVLNQVMNVNPKLSQTFMLFFADQLRESEELRDIVIIKNRVAWLILKMMNIFGVDKQKKLNFTIPRKDIASYCITTYESVVRSLSELNNEGLITIDNKDIIINDKNNLRKLYLSK